MRADGQKKKKERESLALRGIEFTRERSHLRGYAPAHIGVSIGIFQTSSFYILHVYDYEHGASSDIIEK